MPLLPQPILADLEAIIQAIIFLVILASGAVRMFRESKDVQRRAERQQQRPQQQPRREQPQRAGEAVEARAAEQRRPPQQDIRSEVEEFLRRVGEGTEDGRQEPKRPRPERRPRVEVIDEESGFEVDERPRQSRRQPRPQPQPAPVASAAAAATAEGIERGESVAEHVAEHMGRGEFAARAAHLGAELSQTDERLEARLHQKFDHGLGNLSARRMAREAADLEQKGLDTAPTLAENLLTLLTTPQGVQQAIILSEVLDRPTDRW